MSLEISLTSEFTEMTDEMIKVIKEKKVIFENQNLLLVKVPLKETTTIVTAEDYKKREAYRSGVGRVIALPRLINTETDPNVAVGDYVVYAHESKYTVNTPVVNFIFNLKLQDDGKDPVICIRDVDVIAVLELK